MLLILSEFIWIINFYFPRNHHKTYSFLMLSVVIEINSLNIGSKIWKWSTTFPKRVHEQITKCKPPGPSGFPYSSQFFFISSSVKLKFDKIIWFYCQIYLFPHKRLEKNRTLYYCFICWIDFSQEIVLFQGILI